MTAASWRHSPLKATLRSRAITRLLGVYLGLCRRTARWELQGTGALRDLAGRPGGFILAFWHENLPLMPLAWSAFWEAEPGLVRKPGLVLVSRSRDGGLIAGLLGRFGLTTVAGSTSKGGRAAGQSLLRGLRQGAVAVVVPDGPRGPRRRMSEGCLRLAAMADVPIVPCGAQARPLCRTGSWDRMMIPLPFARCVAVAGTPILPGEQELAQGMELLGAALDRTMEQAAEALGGPARPLARRHA
ncbi:lysophospholipid acyltransferase family protein [Roseomonas sp. OT10]|uniref:lysophospholipid acyltransferase family protein n=1 Tax=Roseomonas cutis TaxID=2897332 RepID=UPI001E5D96B3|nr:lysophospholipid acyltransferase family protein [Roseomonas sp. OT10]UFN49563.1 lysophospholipid acyltransferase family protein [Roseomonas sp. OT10]